MGETMRRSDRQLTDEETRKLLAEGEYGILSTADESGTPYGVPMSYALKDNTLYLHCAQSGLKLKNIEQNERVSFCVVGKTEILAEKFSTKYESVIASGRASMAEGDEKIAALMALVTKYSPDFMAEGQKYAEKAAAQTVVIKVALTECTGKARR